MNTKRKHPVIRQMEGNPARRPIPHLVVPASPCAPTCPNSILGPVGRKEWRRIVPLLEELGMISQLDLSTLAGYCAAFETFVLAQRKLQNEDMVIEGSKRGPQRNPYLIVRDEALKQLRSFAGDLGLSISARCRLSIPGSPLDALDREIEKLLESAPVDKK